MLIPMVALLGILAACAPLLAFELWRAGQSWVAAVPGVAPLRVAVAGAPPYWQGTRCWNAWCVLRNCDQVHHCDPHGRTWTQPEGWVFNRRTRTYQPPKEA